MLSVNKAKLYILLMQLLNRKQYTTTLRGELYVKKKKSYKEKNC